MGAPWSSLKSTSCDEYFVELFLFLLFLLAFTPLDFPSFDTRYFLTITNFKIKLAPVHYLPTMSSLISWVQLLAKRCFKNHYLCQFNLIDYYTPSINWYHFVFMFPNLIEYFHCFRLQISVILQTATIYQIRYSANIFIIFLQSQTNQLFIHFEFKKCFQLI